MGLGAVGCDGVGWDGVGVDGASSTGLILRDLPIRCFRISVLIRAALGCLDVVHQREDALAL